MATDAEAFYDALARHYHLIYEDWEQDVPRQGEVINALIGELLGPGKRRILDSACGIGTQAIGLTLCGHEVTGSDISRASLRQARRWAERFETPVEFLASHMEELTYSFEPEGFDVVCALDNALPHLDPQDELRRGLREVGEVLKSGGLFLASIRDYEELGQERPRSTPPRVYDDGSQSRRVVFQVWDWWTDRAGYDFTLYLICETAFGAPTAYAYRGSYFMFCRNDISEALNITGFSDICWHEPGETGFHQPIVSARRP